MLRKLVLISAVFLLAFSACTPSASPTEAPAPPEVAPTESPPPPLPEPTKEPAPVSMWPMTLVDALGREITLEKAPERIVSLSPSNTEVLFAAGAGDLVVGNTEYCDYPEEASAIEKVGGFSAKTISVEAIVALNPDLVFSNDSGHEPIIEALEQANIVVYAVKAASFEDVFANLELVGKLTENEDIAAQVVDGMKTRIVAVEEKIATVPQEERPSVFWEVWDEPLLTSGPNTFSAQMIKIAGGVNIFPDLTEDYPQISVEEVVSRNPDVIMGPDTHGDKLVIGELTARPGWEEITAVIDGRIYLIDGNKSSRPGPRLVDALEEIAASLYPDLFE
ncbi:MAG: cobalamin-binding protein [Anaerolineaceae bacterium 4572_5.1]|nr:MAG: cobalamin-binding protein [Anaerolineaceae bacterium 4572_5.1]